MLIPRGGRTAARRQKIHVLKASRDSGVCDASSFSLYIYTGALTSIDARTGCRIERKAMGAERYSSVIFCHFEHTYNERDYFGLLLGPRKISRLYIRKFLLLRSILLLSSSLYTLFDASVDTRAYAQTPQSYVFWKRAHFAPCAVPIR